MQVTAMWLTVKGMTDKEIDDKLHKADLDADLALNVEGETVIWLTSPPTFEEAQSLVQAFLGKQR